MILSLAIDAAKVEFLGIVVVGDKSLVLIGVDKGLEYWVVLMADGIVT